MASTKTRRTGKEGLHTRVKQGKKAVKDREVIEEQSADSDHRLLHYTFTHVPTDFERRVREFASDAGFGNSKELLQFVEDSGLRLTLKDLPDNAPVAEADELAQVLCNMARICGWRLTYKLERL